MKIVILDMDNLKNPFWASGQARATREFGKRLAQKNEVTVYSSKYPGYSDYTEDGIQYIHIGAGTRFSRFNNLMYLFALPFTVRKIQADVILEEFTAPTSVCLSPLFTRIPVVALPTIFEAYTLSKKYHLPFHWIEKWGSKYYRYFTPYTQEVDAKMKSYNPHIISKIIPQGVGEEFFSIPREKPEYIMFMGRFDNNQKGIDLLLEGYSKVAEKINLPLRLIGYGPDERNIRETIKQKGLEHKVTIHGPMYGEEKKDLLSRAAFAAFPSRHEGFSLFSLEAIASGLPLVSFDIPSLSWADNTVALKAKPYDTTEYGELLLRLSNDTNLQEYMSTEARKTATLYSWDTVASEFESFFTTIINPVPTTT